MHGFLVIARGPIDDIPVKLYKQKDAALRYAQNLKTKKVLELAKRFGLDTSVVLHISVLEFQYGKPVGKYIHVKEADDE